MPALTGLLTIMEKAARKAGGKLRRDFGEIEHLQVRRKALQILCRRPTSAPKIRFFTSLKMPVPIGAS